MPQPKKTLSVDSVHKFKQFILNSDKRWNAIIYDLEKDSYCRKSIYDDVCCYFKMGIKQANKKKLKSFWTRNKQKILKDITVEKNREILHLTQQDDSSSEILKDIEVEEDIQMQSIDTEKSNTPDLYQTKYSRPSESPTQNATQGNSRHSEQFHIKEEPLEADPSDYRLYQQLRDSIKTEPDNSETDSTNGDPEKHIHSISTDKEHFVNVKKEYSDSCENEISENLETEQIPMFESVFVKEEELFL